MGGVIYFWKDLKNYFPTVYYMTYRCRFHDLKYFEIIFFLFIFLELIIHLKSSSQNFVEDYQFNAMS
jgi:hypothetical protein